MTADDLFRRAYRAIASARILCADGDLEGACNRAYYAMFHAVQGALLTAHASVGHAITKTHSGFIGAFGEHLIKTGMLPASLGRSLNQAHRIRQIADYTGDPLDRVQVERLIEQAQVFVETVQRELAHHERGSTKG